MESTDQARKASEFLSGMPVIDCDVHPSLKTEKLNEKRARRLENPYNRLLTEDGPGMNAYPKGVHPMSTPGKVDVLTQVVEDAADIYDPLMNEFGIDRAVLNSLLLLDIIPDAQRAVQEMRATNDVLIEHYLDGNDELYGLCSLATHKPHLAAEEIDRMATEDSIVGAVLIDGSSEKPLGDERYDIIYRSAEDNDFPVVYHTGTGPLPQTDRFPLDPLQFDTYTPVHTLAHPFAHMQTMVSLLFSGVPEKFPDLDFVFMEGGLGWVPYMTYRLNREYQERRWDAPLLERLPEEYVRDRFYFGTQPLEEPASIEHARQIIDMVGADSLLFSTDHPHFDFDHPGSVVRKYFGHLSADDLEKVLYRNAQNVYGIDVGSK